ncbi:MAG TPA: PaaX family transcriptional regulator C-terminal domain-containing protein, partial [Piscinibacter sp.]|nr:PaaX family transcriptional regulator C-terminal domain-containing protein [Piscinibacter sp.]
ALGVRELIAACALFELPENNVRVALARAVAAGQLATPRRGAYALSAQSRPLADEVGRWRSLEDQIVEWRGDWLAVHVGATGRSDRPALRARERAFGILGLAEFERGLHLRPDNLAGGVASLRERLAHLVPQGTELGTVFVLGGLAAADAQRAAALWDAAALDAHYRDGTARLSAWLENARALPLERAARESFELGHAAIRSLVFDPLLPAPLVDAAARSRFIKTVARFDDAGKAVWQRFLKRVRAAAPQPALAS